MPKAGTDGAEKSAPSYKAGKYKCPKCANTIQVFITMSAPPVCGKHPTGAVIMEVKK